MRWYVVITAIACCCVLVYLFVQNHILQISNHEINNIKIPKQFNNYRIAHLSDFHSTGSMILKHMLLKRLTAKPIDLIVITGDLIDHRHVGWYSSASFLKKIIKIAPVCFVSGNHEVTTHNYIHFVSYLQSIGVVVLRNETLLIERDGEKIQICGMEDPAIHKPAKVSLTAKKHLQSIDFMTNHYSILLTHRPELFKLYAHQNFDLVLAGHAHGGQFIIPKIGGVFSPGEGMWPKYTEGCHKLKETQMIVSRGIGRSSFPFRINNRPELIFINLNSSSNTRHKERPL